MNTSIAPLNVAAATLLIQIIFISILTITTCIYLKTQPQRRANTGLVGQPPTGHRKTTQNPTYIPTLALALASITALLVSDDFYGIWSPIFQGVEINTLSASNAIYLVFVLDLILVSYLIYTSGGAKSSPFLTAIFTLPALGIFLRLPPTAFMTFALLATFLYLFLFIVPNERNQSAQKAAAFMNISCLLLSMLTGYITRPIPIDQLKSNESQIVNAPATPDSQPACIN